VKHKKWGVGVVVGIDGTGHEAILKVAFPDIGVKDLIAGYAPLEIV
jgi:DNA helicase-2/ATP-dependent DNA helicase PcrA